MRLVHAAGSPFLMRLLFPVGLVVFLAALIMLAPGKLEAAVPGRGENLGYFSGNLAPCASSSTCEFVSSSGANYNNVTDLINGITGNLSSSNSEDSTGAEFTILVMLGIKAGDPRATPSYAQSSSTVNLWKQTVTSYAAGSGQYTGCKITFNVLNYGYSENTAYDPSNNDIFGYSDPGASANSIVFSCGGKVQLAIKRLCGNLVGTINGIYQSSPSWTLTGHSSVSPTTLDPGQSATFIHWVHNNGPDTAQFNWQVQGKYIESNGTVLDWDDSRCGNAPYGTSSNGITSQTGPPSSCAGNSLSGSASIDTIGAQQPGGCPNGSKGVANTDCKYETYEFPNDAQNGDQYCERMTYTPNTSTDNSPGNDQGVCVTYHTVTCSGSNCPAAIVGDCTSALFNVGQPHLAPGDTTTSSNVRYALYETPAGGASLPSFTAPTTLSSTTGYPNVTAGSISQSATNSPDSVSSYSLLTNNKITSGNVQWYLVTYNVWTTGSGASKVYYTGINSVVATPVIGPCYTATCTISNIVADADVPGSPAEPNPIQDTSGFTATVTITNTGVNEIPDSGGTASLVSTENWGETLASVDETLGQNDTESFPVSLWAPGSEGAYTFGCRPQYSYGSQNLWMGSEVTQPINAYAYFHMSPVAQFGAGVNEEDPSASAIPYTTGVTVDNTGAGDTMPNPPGYITANTTSTLSENGSTLPGQSTTRSDSYYDRSYAGGPYNPTSVNIGDTYCVAMSITDHASGWVWTSGVTEDISNPQTASTNSCFAVHDDPYYKVYNSGVTAGADFTGACSGGELASWNNNSGTNPKNYDFGASAQFNALALRNIIGFASDQQQGGTASANPGLTTGTGLTFANTVGATRDSYSPNLGGQFAGCQPLTDQSAPMNSPSLPANNNVPPTTGTYTHSGNLDLNGGAVSPGQNVSIFVTGDVYVENNITYTGNSGGSGGSGVTWANASQVPSFVLHATGNIYIDPRVTELDGVYISDKTGGAIYTCGVNNGGSSFSPMPAANLLSCNNQLTVYGEFEADNVNLMRTFGSLRDEKPTTTTSSGLTYKTTGWTWQQPISGGSCTTIYNTGDPDWPKASSLNQFCIPGTSSVTLKWQTGGCITATGASTLASALASAGANPALVTSWASYNLCVSGPIGPLIGDRLLFTTSNGPQCLNITNSADADWPSNIYLCEQGIAGPPTPVVVPVYPPFKCSNDPTGSGAIWQTCAAEVFDFSPELYLSAPSVEPPSGGAAQFQAITSLPPVL